MLFFIYAYLFILSVMLSLVFTRLIIKFAVKHDIVDRPGERKIHSSPVPLLGGIAVYISFLLAVAINTGFIQLMLRYPGMFAFLPKDIADLLSGAPAVWGKLRVILYTGTVIVLLGLLDDMKSLNARVKLLVQAAAASALVVFGIRITLFMGNVYVGAVITVIWVVGITNAFNLLDNMDGLSPGVACTAAFIFFATAIIQGSYFVGAILLVFAGSVLGFLRYNFNPAKVFMGDTGSLFIGYLLSSLTILNTYYTEGAPTFFPVIMPVLILAVPIFDTASVIIIRLKRKESIFTPDKSHFSHRLVNLGLTQKQAVLLVYLVSFSAGAGSLLLLQVNLPGAIIICLQAAALFGIIAALETAGARTKKRE